MLNWQRCISPMHLCHCQMAHSWVLVYGTNLSKKLSLCSQRKFQNTLFTVSTMFHHLQIADMLEIGKVAACYVLSSYPLPKKTLSGLLKIFEYAFLTILLVHFKLVKFTRLKLDHNLDIKRKIKICRF